MKHTANIPVEIDCNKLTCGKCYYCEEGKELFEKECGLFDKELKYKERVSLNLSDWLTVKFDRCPECISTFKAVKK